MALLNSSGWETAAGLAVMAVLGTAATWLVLHNRRTPEELERARRLFLVQSGRLVDGMMFDVCDVEAKDGRLLTMLLFSYRIAGVDYECSQDITGMGGVVETAQVRAGFPCTVRYQPGNPQNSIVVAEGWTGLRVSLPVLPEYEHPESLDLSHLRPGRG